VAWGYSYWGASNDPQPNADFIAIAAGGGYSMGLKADGTIQTWGGNGRYEYEVPPPNRDFIAIHSSGWRSLGLKANGSIVLWTSSPFYHPPIPPPNSDFVAISGSDESYLGLKSDGTLVSWGNARYGPWDVPEPNGRYLTMEGGGRHVLAIRQYHARSEHIVPRKRLSDAKLAIHSLTPNPFNPVTEIAFENRASGAVALEVYDTRGVLVARFPLGVMSSGQHRVRWNGRDRSGSNVSSGVYFLRLNGADGPSQSVKAVLVR
jgi:hypothetical protein